VGKSVDFGRADVENFGSGFGSADTQSFTSNIGTKIGQPEIQLISVSLSRIIRGTVCSIPTSS
jgi:hypothetical protein